MATVSAATNKTGTDEKEYEKSVKTETPAQSGDDENNSNNNDSNENKPKFEDWKQYPTQQIEEVLQSSNKYLSLYFDRVQTIIEKDKYFEHRYNRIVLNNGIPGVVIVAINAKHEIGLMRIFRYPVNSWSWEFPRGFGSIDENGNEMDPTISAKKELAEEMYVRIPKGHEMIYLGQIFENSGICAGRAKVYLALNVIPLPLPPNTKENTNNKENTKEKENTNTTQNTNENNNKNKNENNEENNGNNNSNNDDNNGDDNNKPGLYRADSVVKLIVHEDEEQIERNKFVTYEEVQKMILNGEIRDSLTMSALQMAICYDNTLFTTKSSS